MNFIAPFGSKDNTRTEIISEKISEQLNPSKENQQSKSALNILGEITIENETHDEY